MSSRPAIVHLIGFPGVGKYTVALQLAALAERSGRTFVVVDNHHTANVLFAVLDVDGVRPVGPDVWDRVGEIREVLFRTIEELSPPAWSFVFTNVLVDGDPVDEALVTRAAQLAAARGAPYVPVVLTCAPDELLRRVPNADRRARRKWIDPDAVGAYVDTEAVIRLADHQPLRIDVTSLAPIDAAQQILDHVDHVDHVDDLDDVGPAPR